MVAVQRRFRESTPVLWNPKHMRNTTLGNLDSHLLGKFQPNHSTNVSQIKFRSLGPTSQILQNIKMLGQLGNFIVDKALQRTLQITNALQ